MGKKKTANSKVSRKGGTRGGAEKLRKLRKTPRTLTWKRRLGV